MTYEELEQIDQRLKTMEKEIADIKRQLEERPEQQQTLIQSEIKNFFNGMTFEKWDVLVNKK